MTAMSRLLAGFFVSATILSAVPVTAATTASPKQINFDSFTGIYHLSRDSRGLSLLTTEETIVANFPDASFYGITRTLPKKFQDRSVNIKILSVSDAGGSSVPYKTKTDKANNLVVTTGDPSITLSGSQTIKIKYHTSGVINLGKKSDEFLLNVNGRGWDQPFSRVNATLYIPANFSAKLQRPASCYTVLDRTNGDLCQIDTKKTADTTVITSSAKFVAPRQALVLKMNFEPTTFTNARKTSYAPFLAAVPIVMLLVLGVSHSRRRKSKS